MTSETIKERIDREWKEQVQKFREAVQVPKNYKIRLCPMCNDGIMRDTGTQHRYECSVCGGIAMEGRGKVITHVKGRDDAREGRR